MGESIVYVEAHVDQLMPEIIVSAKLARRLVLNWRRVWTGVVWECVDRPSSHCMRLKECVWPVKLIGLWFAGPVMGRKRDGVRGGMQFLAWGGANLSVRSLGSCRCFLHQACCCYNPFSARRLLRT